MYLTHWPNIGLDVCYTLVDNIQLWHGIGIGRYSDHADTTKNKMSFQPQSELWTHSSQTSRITIFWHHHKKVHPIFSLLITCSCLALDQLIGLSSFCLLWRAVETPYSSHFQPVCHSTLVCREWSIDVREFGWRSFFGRAIKIGEPHTINVVCPING